jgi:hypothetical protein
VRVFFFKHPLNNKGATAVEFAIILPLLLLVIFGIIEWGLYMYNRQILTNAVREGTRYGVLMRPGGPSRNENDADENPKIKSEVVRYAANWLVTFGDADDAELTTNDVKIVPETGRSLTFGSDLRVEVEYDYQFLFLSLPPLNLGPLEIKIVATMKME